MIRFAMDGILSFSVVPLKIAVWTGLMLIWFAVATIIVAIVGRFLGGYDLRLDRGWASVLVAVLLIGNIQLLCLESFANTLVGFTAK